MREIRIRFITTAGFVSWAIRRVTFSEFSHVELVTDTGYIGAHSDGGVQERQSGYCAPLFERRYALPVTETQYRMAMAYARGMIGTPYNFKDIAGLLFHHNWSTPKRVICSMFVLQCFQAAGIQLLNVLPQYSNLVTPDTLHLSPLLIGNCYFQTLAPK